MIRDRIVLRICDSNTWTDLLKVRDLTLARCVDICKTAENLCAQNNALNPATVHKLKDHPKKKFHSKKEAKERECLFCRKTHVLRKNDCPAWGQECSSCSEKNHFACKCLKKAKSKPKKSYKKKALHNVTQEESSSEGEWVNSLTS